MFGGGGRKAKIPGSDFGLEVGLGGQPWGQCFGLVVILVSHILGLALPASARAHRKRVLVYLHARA